MIQAVHKYPVSQILDPDLKCKYMIPKFQREYIWGKSEWEKLIDDIDENDEGYFLGSIIIVNRATDSFDIAPLEIIDGQQRLATLSLIYAVIYSILIKDKSNDGEDIARIVNLKYRLVTKGTKNQPRIDLSYQNRNYQDYRAILTEIGLLDEEKPENLGNRKIYKAFQYFKSKFEDTSRDNIINFLDKINGATLVKIEVSNHADAFILFDSLNNRGVPLSAMDIIKNNLLSALEKRRIYSIDEAANDWVKIIDNIPDYRLQERFLRQLYNSKLDEELYKIKGINKATRPNLIKIYDKLIDKEPKKLFDDIKSGAKLYADFIGNNQIADDELKILLEDLNRVQAAPVYTFLLYIFSEYKDNNEIKKSIVSFFIKYFLKRNLTDLPATRKLDDIFIDIIRYCRNVKLDLTVELIKKYLKENKLLPPEDIFFEKLRGDIYEENYEATRFILTKIEEEHMTKETKKDLWEIDNNRRYVWTIEHILPEGKNLPENWIYMIANGDKTEAEKLQKEWVHKIGNLTLSGYNQNLGTLSFIEKRDRQDKRGNYIGYRNSLYLNKDLAIKNKWTIEDIKERTNKLIDEAIKIFEY